jgi:hypothetical protein
MLLSILCLIVACFIGISSSKNAIEIVINGLTTRVFYNVSLGNNYHLDSMGHQCTADKRIKHDITQQPLKNSKGETEYVPRMRFTANRRLQNATNSDALHQRLKLAVVLAVGGHGESNYNYGPYGSINGLLAVWDSWLENFFSFTSNTTSLILLFDEKDFLKQNVTQNHEEYLDSIVVKNMGASLVDCVSVKTTGQVNIHSHFGQPSRVRNHNSKRHGLHHHMHSRSLECSSNLYFESSHSIPDHLEEEATRLSGPAFYRVYYVDIKSAPYASNHPDYIYQRPFVFFAAIHRFPIPLWLVTQYQRDHPPRSGALATVTGTPTILPSKEYHALLAYEDEVAKQYKPFKLNRRYPTTYNYVKFTNWYSYAMFATIHLLDFFDYAAKLDNDVSFVQPFPVEQRNLPAWMVQQRTYMMMTTPDYYTDDPRISQGVEACLVSYLQQEIEHCQIAPAKNTALQQTPPKVNQISIEYNPYTWINHNEANPYLRPGGYNSTEFFAKSFNLTFRAHFLVYWLGLYAAPETMHLGAYWNQFHPRGMWDYRWGDQQYWPRPIAMFGQGNLDREIWKNILLHSDRPEGPYVVHKLWPRQATVQKVNYFEPVNGTTAAERKRLYDIAAKPFIYR